MVDINLTPAVVNISGVRAGDRNLFNLTLRSAGKPMDLTGYTVLAQARTTVQASTELDAVCTVTDPAGGGISVRWPGDAVRTWLGSDNTKSGLWDLQLDDGSGGDPWTIISGNFEAEMDITRTP